MPPAARVLDPTSHPGVIAGPGVIVGPGALNVLIGGQPAARVSDVHVCAMPPVAGPHPPTSIVAGSATVFIAGLPAARMGDANGCGATIAAGCPNVLIG